MVCVWCTLFSWEWPVIHAHRQLEQAASKKKQQACVFYRNRRARFEVTSDLERGYDLQSKETCCAVGDLTMAPRDAGDVMLVLEAPERCDAMDAAPW